MKFDTNRALAVFMTLLVAVSAIGAFAGSAAAAEPTVDTNSDLTDTDTWVDFNASSNDTKQINFTNTDAADGALVVWNPDTGTNPSEAQVHAEFDNSSDEFYVRNSTADEYGFNISGDDLATMPMEAGENKTVKFTIANESDWQSDSANLTTMDVTLDNTMERSVMYIGDYQVQNNAYGLEQTEEDGWIFDDKSTSLDTTRTIDGSNTTVYAYLANDTAANHFDSDFGGLDAGDWTKDTLTQLGDDNAVKNYANELPDDLSSDTSALRYDSSGSTDALVLELGDEYDGESEIDMQVDSDPGRIEKLTAYGFSIPFTDMNFGVPDWIPGVGMAAPAAGASMAGLGLIAGHKRFGA